MRAARPDITRGDWIALAVFPLVIFGLLISAGHLTTGPRITDDNQIYKLQIELSEAGFWQVLGDELTSRFEMSRLVPVYNLHKVTLATVFGGNLVAWSTWNGIVGVLTAGLLFWALRRLEASIFESFAFALITLLGPQSIVWWRLLHGEGIGMLFLAAALVAMALRVRSGRFAYEIAFAGAAALSALSKESFLLALPPLLLLKILLTGRLRGLGLRAAFRHSLFSVVSLATLSVAAALIIKVIFRTTHFSYSGWIGFNPVAFLRVLIQYVTLASYWLLPALVLIYLSSRLVRRSTNATGAGGSEPADDGSTFLFRSWVVAGLFWATLTVPQLLLYMSSGILEIGHEAGFSRYILPCFLGYAFLIAQMLRLIRSLGDRGRLARVLAITCTMAYLLTRASVAHEASQEFAKFSNFNDQWFETVVENTRADSAIVVAYLNGVGDGGVSTQAALRVYYLLFERYHRQNLYFLPFPPLPTLEEGRLAAKQADTRRHGKRLRPVSRLPEGQPVDAILILNWAKVYERQGPTVTREVLEKYLLGRSWPWFEPQDFTRRPHPHGHVSYLRIRARSSRLTPPGRAATAAAHPPQARRWPLTAVPWAGS